MSFITRIMLEYTPDNDLVLISWSMENLVPKRVVVVIDDERKILWCWKGTKNKIQNFKTLKNLIELISSQGLTIGNSKIGKDPREVFEIDQKDKKSRGLKSLRKALKETQGVVDDNNLLSLKEESVPSSVKEAIKSIELSSTNIQDKFKVIFSFVLESNPNYPYLDPSKGRVIAHPYTDPNIIKILETMYFKFSTVVQKMILNVFDTSSEVNKKKIVSLISKLDSNIQKPLLSSIIEILNTENYSNFANIFEEIKGKDQFKSILEEEINASGSQIKPELILLAHKLNISLQDYTDIDKLFNSIIYHLEHLNSVSLKEDLILALDRLFFEVNNTQIYKLMESKLSVLLNLLKDINSKQAKVSIACILNVYELPNNVKVEAEISHKDSSYFHECGEYVYRDTHTDTMNVEDYGVVNDF